ncbi:MAG TPA: hypothetical protein VGH28_13990 [Polyangiaceae bacterium]
MNVIRRPARRAIVAAAPVAPAIAVPKPTPADKRDRLVRNRDRRIHGEVEALFREHGAKIFNGDPLRIALAVASGGDS